tara:strand:- start:250 stop:666 length:417 start_codon:yes stop_codon:yes gene_type:complete
MQDYNKFLSDYEDSYSIYKDFKKDFFIVSIAHIKFKNKNPKLKKKLIDDKLEIIINTYRASNNNDFDKNKYIQCSFVWENINEYLNTILMKIAEKKVLDEYDDITEKKFINKLTSFLNEMKFDISKTKNNTLKKYLKI